MKSLKILTVLLILPILTFAQQTATGYVYEDLNSNLKKDRREKGIPNVAVSNGVEVVQTDSEGKYSLPISDDQLIFVIKPSDYEFHKGEKNLQKFYYNHKPQGSPKLKYQGVSPTGPLPKSIDFAMLPGTGEEAFSALIFGDPQPYTLDEIEFFKKGIVKEVEEIQDVKFGLSLGDLVGDDLSLFPSYIDAVSKVNLPWFNVMGNHDQNFDVEEDKLTDETFEAYFGPSTYSFNEGKVHFLVLENILYPDPRDAQGYWGGFREDQLTFIENDLQFVPKDHLIVIAMHIPIFEEGILFGMRISVSCLTC
jgi:3',5'-cyclic AMP phosphodiesterase CpdA